MGKPRFNEMNGVWIDFKIKEKGNKPSPGYNNPNLMAIFYVKTDFTRKMILISRGDQTVPPSPITYSSVVSRENVHISFLIAVLNDLDLSMFNIGSMYLMSLVADKLYTVLGTEFDKDQGKNPIIVRAIYGLKTSGAAFQKFFAENSPI